MGGEKNMSYNKGELQDIIEALTKQNTFEYPLESLKVGYLGTLEQRLEEYAKRLEELSDNSISQEVKESIVDIRTLNHNIIQIIKTYLSGQTEDAYKYFGDMLNHQREHLEALIEEKQEEEEVLYRVRASEAKGRKGIFHIPFNMRHLVSTMRYSIAGVPCLYFGNTIYACWLEMGKPDLNSLNISKFRNAIPVKILNFAITFKTLDGIPTFNENGYRPYSKEKIIHFLKIYPLVLACSFKKKEENASFHMEYIIPNMLLQWISSQKTHVDGIKYFSTKMKHDSYDSIGANIVFPPKENKDSMEGFCPKLEKTFKFTAPISWHMINTFPLKDVNTHSPVVVGDHEKIIQSSDEVMGSHYKMTKFYQIEENIDDYFEFLFLNDETRPKRYTIDDFIEENSFDDENRLDNSKSVEVI